MSEENAKQLPDLSGIMSMISGNPALMEMASSILSGLPRSESAAPPQNAEASPDTAVGESAAPSFGPPPSFDPELFSKIVPMLSGGSSAKSSPSDERRCALLRALRPYLSPERRDAIDHMLKFSRLGDLLQIFEQRK